MMTTTFQSNSDVQHQAQEPSKCILQVSIDNFSSENIHRPGTAPEIQRLLIKGETWPNHIPTFYANGNNNANKGYVSIVWNDHKGPVGLSDLGFKVVYISVVDFEGNLRFTQTTSLNVSHFSEFGFDKYIAREILLCQSSELLPRDILTLHVEIHSKTFYNFLAFDWELNRYLNSCFDHVIESEDYVLALDSELAKRLCEESAYFRRMLEAPMLERQTRQWRVCGEEYPSFFNIALIMMGSQYIKVDDISDVHSMYIVSDKYDIPVIKEICRHLFAKHIYDGNVDLILDVARTFNDDILKEIVERFQEVSDYRNKPEESNSVWSVESLYGMMLVRISDFERKPKLDFYS